MKKYLSFLFGISLLSFTGFSQASSDPIIAGKNIAVAETNTGKVRGYIHNGIFTYKGIPYAYSERFMPPAKPTEWKNERSSMSYGPVCPTDVTTTVFDEFEFPFHHDLGYSNEHCQTLNVWSQKINDGKKRPVMVWFHGGGFTAGSTVELPSYDGESLARKGDVVVVTVNHRLNILGFLDLSAYGEKYKASANAGLIDLVASLQWVKDNIAKFGGDPNNVTIFGQSGGGGKVTSLMNAPSAKGLFHKAIVQSGSYLTNFTDKSLSQKVAAALLDELQLQPAQVDSLQKISYERLNAAGKKAIRKVQDDLRAQGKTTAGFGLGWGPVLDGDFLPYQPSEAAAVELSKSIPLLVGTTKNEFTPFNPTNRGISMDTVNSRLKRMYGQQSTAYISAVKKAYPNTVKPSDYIDLDINFRQGAINQATAKAAAGTAPVYMYLFAWQSPVNDGIYKAMHCMELPFVFNNIDRCEEMTGGGKDAHALADKMSGAWINFAKTGNPNTSGLPTWPMFTAATGSTMIFDSQSRVANRPDAELLKIASARPGM
ncbi:carboxylesterase/lipase family protein [Segetibacter aerophilus]|uniref:Carboxylic ester hydrolase n=1 Tax=Segetibacter aerophilus TaxID=670293 RepID=A0A512BJZ9_9BACT|nr:carboxylesterase/lipase family protein [Segetibacter aerophilus]GEO12289.1 para-nitrobenzyl esterase [Segetibacter aerophilus]